MLCDVFLSNRCLTCSRGDNDAICVSCVKSCHKDHTIQFVRHDRYSYILNILASILARKTLNIYLK